MNHKYFEMLIPGIGATDEFNLRVSVATLVRVLFENPKHGESWLALERKATLFENEGQHFVEVKSQPFGGAIRIHNLRALQDIIGNFHFDSEQSRSEQDFRLFIRLSAWKPLQEFCLLHFSRAKDFVLESNPTRELVEEFAEALDFSLKQDQYICTPAGTIIENDASPTENFYAKNYPTVRIYRIFETHILDASLASAMIRNSESFSDDVLRKRALENARQGGLGWANAILAFPLKKISAAYSAISPNARNSPIFFQNHKLDETVAAVLENIPVQKYQRL